MYERIAKLTGNPHIAGIDAKRHDHCCHETAGMKRAEKKVERLTGRVDG